MGILTALNNLWRFQKVSDRFGVRLLVKAGE
jgi:allophanate hydrolase subunit 2